MSSLVRIITAALKRKGQQSIVFYHTTSAKNLQSIMEKGLFKGSYVTLTPFPYKRYPRNPYFKEKGISNYVRIDISLSPEEASRYLGFMAGAHTADVLGIDVTKMHLGNQPTPLKLTPKQFRILGQRLLELPETVFLTLDTIPPSKIVGSEKLV